MQDIADLLAGKTLDAGRAEALFDRVFAGQVEPAQLGAILALLQARGATPQELAGAARSMRTHVLPVPYQPGPGQILLDTCGTGGAPKTFNVSTAAAVVAAAADPRVRVAKHGNRSRTGRGSAEVLAALGVNIDASAETQARCLERAGLCFCFAIHAHPAMKHAGPTRKALGVPTLFNLLGPLTNPAGAAHQLIGVYDARFLPLVAQCLRELGSQRAMVVHSREGLDEIGLGAPTDALLVENGSIEPVVIEPAALGFKTIGYKELVVEDVDASASIIRAILAGTPGPHRDIVVMNAAAALLTAGVCANLAEGLQTASDAIDRGAAKRTLETLAAESGTAASG